MWVPTRNQRLSVHFRTNLGVTLYTLSVYLRANVRGTLIPKFVYVPVVGYVPLFKEPNIIHAQGGQNSVITEGQISVVILMLWCLKYYKCFKQTLKKRLT